MVAFKRQRFISNKEGHFILTNCSVLPENLIVTNLYSLIKYHGQNNLKFIKIKMMELSNILANLQKWEISKQLSRLRQAEKMLINLKLI